MKLQLISGLAILCSLASAQSFDVASVRPLQAGQPRVFRFDKLPGNREVRATASLSTLIRMIYNTSFDRVVVKVKGASWVDTDLWDLGAKSEQPFTEPEMMAMLQGLLADKFKLQVEKEQRPGTIYVLSVDPGGLKIKKNEDATAYPRTEFAAERTAGGANLVINATAITMSRLTFTSPFWELRAPVVDATGLVDRYDIRWVLGDPADVNPMDPATIIETCKRQLGLKLAATKGQVDIINITRVEKPAEN
jgi:uncharacterized protein (TIGR03435 family)